MKARNSRERPEHRRRLEAARWFVILQGTEMSSGVLRSWKRWEADPENRKAFDAIEQMWVRTEQVDRPVVPSLTAASTDEYDASESVAAWRARVGARPASSSQARRAPHYPHWYFGIAATVLLSIGIISMFVVDRWRPAQTRVHIAVFATDVGQHREIQLNDGSLIKLGARTSVTTTMDERSRTVVLDRGEALFTVAHDPDRPFHVMAGGGTITALGTAFNVRRRDDDQVVVTVTEGVVQISPSRLDTDRGIRSSSAARSAPAPKRLEGGQEITYDFSGTFSELRIADAAMAVTWQDGRLTYQGESLRNVVLDVNRYSRKQIVLEDRAAGQLRYSGTVFERDIEEWVNNLEVIYPGIEVTVTDSDHIVIGRRASPAAKQER